MTAQERDRLVAVARRLAVLYGRGFGGKDRGRYRVSRKLLCELAARARLYPEEIGCIGRELYELGFVLIDLESFFVVLSRQTFASYRRVNSQCLDLPDASEDVPEQA